MAQISTASPAGECIMNTLKRAYKANLEDSKRLIEIARNSGDSELLLRAEADLNKWELKLKGVTKQG